MVVVKVEVEADVVMLLRAEPRDTLGLTKLRFELRSKYHEIKMRSKIKP